SELSARLGRGPAEFRGPDLPGSTRTPSAHSKCAWFPATLAHGWQPLPSDRRSRCSYLSRMAVADGLPIPCSIQSRCPTYSGIPWLSLPPQPPHPRLACLPPYLRLLAYLLPSSWNSRGLPCLMHSR